MTLGVVGFEVLYKSKKLFASTLFEQTHQVGSKCFAICCRNLLDFVTTFTKESFLFSLENKCPVDALPLEILRHSGLQQNFDKLSTTDDVLGNQIDIPITILA